MTTGLSNVSMVPIAIKISLDPVNPARNSPSDIGIFKHTPRSFNYDIYTKNGGSLYFYKTEKYSEWRTIIGQLEAGGPADPNSNTLGSGDQNPCGLSVPPDGKYQATGQDGWIVKFIWNLDELAAEEPCTPASAFMKAAVAAGLTIPEKVAEEWITLLDGESEALMVSLLKDGIEIDDLKKVRADFYANFKEGERFEVVLREYQQKHLKRRSEQLKTLKKERNSISSFVEMLMDESCYLLNKGPSVPTTALDQDNVDDLLQDLGFESIKKETAQSPEALKQLGFVKLYEKELELDPKKNNKNALDVSKTPPTNDFKAIPSYNADPKSFSAAGKKGPRPIASKPPKTPITSNPPKASVLEPIMTSPIQKEPVKRNQNLVDLQSLEKDSDGTIKQEN